MSAFQDKGKTHGMFWLLQMTISPDHIIQDYSMGRFDATFADWVIPYLSHPTSIQYRLLVHRVMDQPGSSHYNKMLEN